MNLRLDEGLSVEVVRTKRIKTASIQITKGTIQAVVPEKLSDARVEALIQKRMPWIRKKLREQSKVIVPKPKEYVSGENFSYLGRNHRLKVIRGSDYGVKLKGGYFEVGVSKESKEKDIRVALVKWYEKHALKRLTDKTKRYADIMGVNPHSVYVRDINRNGVHAPLLGRFPITGESSSHHIILLTTLWCMNSVI